MTGKDIRHGELARNPLIEGAKKLSDIVSCTMGPGGGSVLYGDQFPLTTKDGVTVARNIVLLDEAENMGAQLVKQAAIKANELAGDGPQPLYSKILTPQGWVTMGSLKVGDVVCGANGTIQEVEGIYPKGKKEIYEVYLGGDRVVECCEDHLWTVTTSWGKVKTLTTKRILDEMHSNEHRDGTRFFTPQSWVDFHTSNQTLHPYLVGLLIGDGSLSGTGSIELSLAEDQEHIIDSLPLPDGIEAYSVYNENKHYHRVKLRGITPDGKTMHRLVDEIGLLGTKSETKFIPTQYLYASIEDREELLRGLADTDGHINSRGRLEYGTVSYQLAQDVVELMRSLGKTVSCYEYVRKPGASYSETTIYRVTELKGDKYGNSILRIVPTGRFTEMQCISVSNPDNLYVTDNFVFTHNTTTTTLLTYELIKSMLPFINKDRYKRQVDLQRFTEMVINYLESNAIPVDLASPMVEAVAKIAGNDETVGQIVGEAFREVGPDAAITLGQSDIANTTIEYTHGFSFDNGYESPFFITDINKMSVEYDDPIVVTMDQSLEKSQHLIKMLETIRSHFGTERPIILVTAGVFGEALEFLTKNKLNNRLKIATVRAPDYSDERRESMKDMAAFLGGVSITPDLMTDVSQIKPAMCGQAKKVIILENKTTFISGNGGEGYQARIDYLTSKLDTSPDYYRKRISRLTGKAAEIKIGSNNFVELVEKRYRYEDAVNATRAALQHGILPGGGIMLALAGITAYSDPTLEDIPHEMRKSLYEALCTPVYKILTNYGWSTDEIQNLLISLLGAVDPKMTYNIETLEVVPYDQIMVIDPLVVVRSAVRTASSIAGQITTTEGLITNNREQLLELMRAAK